MVSGLAGPSSSGLASTGLRRLDELLGGGLPVGSVVALAGPPGAGKSILSFHVLAHQALAGHRTLYVSTIHQPATKLRTQYSSLTFLREDGLLDRIALRTPDPHMAPDLTSSLRLLVGLMEETDCQVVAVDSFRAIVDKATRKDQVWEFLAHLSNDLARSGRTAILAGEYTLPDDLNLPEFAMADVVIGLEVARQAAEDSRTLRVYKVRGGPFQEGAFSFSISQDGIQFT